MDKIFNFNDKKQVDFDKKEFVCLAKFFDN